MELDAQDMEVIVLSTRPPELTRSELAHVEVLRARCRYLRRGQRSREPVRRPPRLGWILAVLLVAAGLALLF